MYLTSDYDADGDEYVDSDEDDEMNFVVESKGQLATKRVLIISTLYRTSTMT
jgi:hypothetical protein